MQFCKIKKQIIFTYRMQGKTQLTLNCNQMLSTFLFSGLADHLLIQDSLKPLTSLPCS